MEFPRQQPIGPIRRNEAGDGDGARIGEELRHFGDAADVLPAIPLTEAQVFVQAEAHVVAVETVGG